MWYEAFWISTSVLGAAFGTSLFLIYVLSSRIPTQEDLIVVGRVLKDEVIKDFTSSGPGGRKTEGLWGFVEGFLQTPVGQDLLKKFTGNLGGGGGGMGGLIGL